MPVREPGLRVDAVMAQPGLRSHRRGQASREEASVHSGRAQGEAARREATWASRLSFDKEKQLKVAMNGLGITDQGAEEWSLWFIHHASKFGAKLRAGLVDFSENKLTSAGAAKLLRAFLAARIPVHVLKLHHNLLQDGGPFAEYLRSSDGCLQELHLSHNDFDARASATIVAAAAFAKGKDGLPSYPRRSGSRGLVPLWLRLEKNNIDDAEFSAIMDTSMPDKLCSARSKWCTPHCCACKVPPAVHAKNLGNQRVNDLVEGPDAQDDEEEEAGDFFTRLLAKSAAKQAAAQAQVPRNAPAEGAADGEPSEGWVRAPVEFWDAELGRYVPDFIDIPPTMDPLRSSLPKAQQEKLSMGLKALIGIGKNQRSDRPLVTSHEVAPPAVASKPGSLKPHRRGSQPSIGNVRQVQVPQPPNLMRFLRDEGFQIGEQPAGLNPEAPEFRPQRREPQKALRSKAQANHKAWDAFGRQVSMSSSTGSVSNSHSEEAPPNREGRAVSLLSAGIRERPMKPMPMKVPIPAECQFGQQASLEAEASEESWPLQHKEPLSPGKDEDSQDACSAFLDDEVSTEDAVDTADSTEDAAGDMPKSETTAPAAFGSKCTMVQC